MSRILIILAMTILTLPALDTQALLDQAVVIQQVESSTSGATTSIQMNGNRRVTSSRMARPMDAVVIDDQGTIVYTNPWMRWMRAGRVPYQMTGRPVTLIQGDKKLAVTQLGTDPETGLSFATVPDLVGSDTAHLTFAEVPAPPAILDPVFAISRLDKDHDRTPVIRRGHIIGTMADGTLIADLGGATLGPVFDQEGRLLGISSSSGRTTLIRADEALTAAKERAITAKAEQPEATEPAKTKTPDGSAF